MRIYPRLMSKALIAVSLIGVLSLAPGKVMAQAFSSAPYFPLTLIKSWSYNVDNPAGTSTVTVNPSLKSIGGAQTTELDTSSSTSLNGSKSFNTSDSNGIRLYRRFTPGAVSTPGGQRDLTLTFSPPVALADGTTSIGSSATNPGGTATAEVSGISGTFPLTYTVSPNFTINDSETITVPADTFTVLNITGSVNVTGTITVLGQTTNVNQTLAFTFYLAQGIGPVKIVSTATDNVNHTPNTSTSLLTGTTPHTLTITGGPSGSPNPVASGGTANLAVSATDNVGHALTYAWTASCPTLGGNGSFNDAALQNPTWTAPANAIGSQQDCTISVTVSDGAGGLSQPGSYQQGVGPPPPHTLTINSGPGGSPNPVASGGTANLSVSATDSLGHALTYAWSVVSCPNLAGTGSFDNAALQTPTWTAPANTTGSQQNCTIQVTVSDGLDLTLNQSPSYIQGVSPSPPHTLTISSGPGGSPNPVASGGTANLSVSATDSLGHALTYLWSVLSCPGLANTGSFNNATLQTTAWTAPANTTGSQQNCTIQVTVSDGAGGLSQQKSYQQGVSPQGVIAPEPLVPQVLNVSIGAGPGGDEQETFLTTDPITAGATYYDPNPACVGVAPVVRQLLFFNLEGQLILTREDVSSTPLAPGSKYQVLSLSLAPGALPAGAYNLIFLVRDCTSVNIFVSGFYPIRVLTP